MKYHLFLLLLIAGCGDSNFPEIEELKGFRILGIEASSPEVSPGGGSSLRLIISDPDGGGRIISGTTESCIDPGVATGANVSCSHDPTTVTGTYTINTTSDADLGSANLYTGFASQSLNITVPNIIFTGRSAREQSNGIGYLTIFRFNVDGKEVTAFKRVYATDRGAFNTNPSIMNVTLEGSSLNVKPQKDETLVVTTNAPETYPYINVDGSTENRAETLAAAWYVSDGEFNKPKSGVNEDVKFIDDTPSGTMLLLVIVRDERGGLALSRFVLP